MAAAFHLLLVLALAAGTRNQKSSAVLTATDVFRLKEQSSEKSHHILKLFGDRSRESTVPWALSTRRVVVAPSDEAPASLVPRIDAEFEAVSSSQGLPLVSLAGE